jgi:hypothetical protein
VWIYQEAPLNIDFGINNERQHRYSVCVGTCGRGRVNGRDEGEGIWLMDFIYIYEIEQ